MAVWSKVQALLVGGTLGRAAAKVVDPALTPAEQNAKARRPYAVLTPETAAAASVRGIATGVDLEDDARRGAVGTARFRLLQQLAREYPGFPEVLTLLRRGEIDDAAATQWLNYQGVSDATAAHMLTLRDSWLTPDEIANAIQQGFLADPGLLPGDPGGALPITPPVEQVDLPALKQAAGAGTSERELAVLTQLAGNPPGPMELLEMWRRGIITETAVDRGIREGRTKTKWTSAFKALYRPLLTPGVITNLRLRGWIERDDANARLADFGYTEADGDAMYHASGRPMAPTQAYNAFFRKAPSPTGSGDFTEQDFYDAVKRSDIRPEYGPALWAIRYAYPSLFQLRGIVQSGAVTRDQALFILEQERYPEWLRAPLVDSWLTGATAGTRDLTAAEWDADFEGGYITETQYRAKLTSLGFSDALVDAKVALGDARRVRSARNARVNRIRASYVGHKITRDEAVAALQQTAVRPAARDLLIAEWDGERAVNVQTLTAAEVRAAYKRGTFTLAQARAELVERGYRVEDADVYLGLAAPRLSTREILTALRHGTITEATALEQLRALGYTLEQAYELLAALITELTSKQVVEAVAAGTLTYDEGLARLEALGYRAADAGLLLAGLEPAP
jgi:hypothetical protein